MIVKHNERKNNNGITLINYSNRRYTKAQKINSKSALEIAGFKKVISYSPADIDVEFLNKNKKILSQQRGGGYLVVESLFYKKNAF